MIGLNLLKRLHFSVKYSNTIKSAHIVYDMIAWLRFEFLMSTRIFCVAPSCIQLPHYLETYYNRPRLVLFYREGGLFQIHPHLKGQFRYAFPLR